MEESITETTELILRASFFVRVERVQTHFLARVALYYYSRSSATPFRSCGTTLFVAVIEKSGFCV